MKELIREIFNECDFLLFKNEKNEETDFFGKNNEEYFIVTFYTNEEFSTFFKHEKTKKLIAFFDQAKQSNQSIEKNTSLLIFVKLNDLRADFNILRNQIFCVEEDEYFFRKYVFVYTEKLVRKIPNEISKLDYFHKIISESDLEEFRKDFFKNV
jgi:hypothetical protein